MHNSTFTLNPDAKRLTAKPRVKKCAVCPCRFEVQRMGQKVCSLACGFALSILNATEASRKVDRARKEALKTRSDHLRELQVIFNACIRQRDKNAGFPCISSGRPLDWSGNNVDAGHYRSIGSAPHLRFDERNVHAQSKQDNRYGSGNAVDYRIGLIARYGVAYVEALEADNEPRKWTIPELIEMKAHYRAKLKELKKAGE